MARIEGVVWNNMVGLYSTVTNAQRFVLSDVYSNTREGIDRHAIISRLCPLLPEATFTQTLGIPDTALVRVGSTSISEIGSHFSTVAQIKSNLQCDRKWLTCQRTVRE